MKAISTRLICPWDMGNLALEGGLCGPEVLRTNPGQTLWSSGVGCHFFLQCLKVKSESEVAQSCPTLATPWTAAYQIGRAHV